LVIVGFSGLEIESATPATNFSLSGVLAASALIFFAFAGYARVATLGEEVTNPSVNVPRAIVIGLGFVLGIYLLVGNALQRGLGQSLGLSVAPIRDFVEAQISWLPGEVVIVVATGACLGSLLSLLAGISRTAEAMADDCELPKAISLRSKRFQSPWVAELLIAAIATLLLLSGDIVWTIGLSSFCVLLYYAIGNLAAFRQLGQTRLFSRVLALAGLVTCLILAILVPSQSLIIGSLLLALALVIRSSLIKLHSSN
jgi:APA family basic amino acid/polyamine antiporter